MADAEDLKSSGDFSSCGFDSHPGHHFFSLIQKELHARLSQCTPRVQIVRRHTGNDRERLSKGYVRVRRATTQRQQACYSA